jgi:hypothetical protein
MNHIPNALLQSSDHRLQFECISEIFRCWLFYPIADPKDLADQALKHLPYFDDPELVCKFSDP